MGHRPLAPHHLGPRSATARLGAVVTAVLVAGAMAAGLFGAASLEATAASAAGAGTSPTCTPAALNVARTNALAALTRRVKRLHDLSAAVGASTGLTTADRSTLTTDIGNDLGGITALQQKVPSDTTCADVAADAQAMVVDYRVFVVMSPQAHLTIAADTETSVAGALTALEPKIAARHHSRPAGGRHSARRPDHLLGLPDPGGDGHPVEYGVGRHPPGSHPGLLPRVPIDPGERPGVAQHRPGGAGAGPRRPPHPQGGRPLTVGTPTGGRTGLD